MELSRADPAPVSRGTAGTPTRALGTRLGELAEPAFGVAVRLTGSAVRGEALVLTAARLAGALRTDTYPADDVRVWFYRLLCRAYAAEPRPGPWANSAGDLDDTPDLYLFGRAVEAGFPIDGDAPAEPLLDALGSERIEAALQRLPDPYRLPCVLYLTDDLTHEQIAAVLEWPVGAVRARIHRGRRMLQKALWQQADALGRGADR